MILEASALNDSTSTDGKTLSYKCLSLPRETSIRQDEHLKKIKRDTDTEPLISVDRNLLPIESISADDIRNSLIVEAKRRKFLTTKKISNMIFIEVAHTFCYHYLLESFTETRSIAEVLEPFSHKSDAKDNFPLQNFQRNVNGPFNRMSLTNSETGNSNPLANLNQISSGFGQNPWDFDVQPDEDFVRQVKILEMPNSHRLVSCNYCKSEGLSHCFHCRGFGTEKCGQCRGTGMKAGIVHPALYTHPMIGMFPNNEQPHSGYPTSVPLVRPALLGASRDKPYAVGTPVHFMAKAGLPPPGIGQHDLCSLCRGRGMKDCQHCKGQGKKSCSTCGGKGEVHAFGRLKVLFDVECSDYYTHCEVPEILLRSADGEMNFSETQSYLHPIKRFPMSEINEVSRKLCAAHLKKMADSCRVLKQRHCVEVIEVAKVKFKLGSQSGHFYVYGKQRLCYLPNKSSNCSLM